MRRRLCPSSSIREARSACLSWWVLARISCTSCCFSYSHARKILRSCLMEEWWAESGSTMGAGAMLLRECILEFISTCELRFASCWCLPGMPSPNRPRARGKAWRMLFHTKSWPDDSVAIARAWMGIRPCCGPSVFSTSSMSFVFPIPDSPRTTHKKPCRLCWYRSSISVIRATFSVCPTMRTLVCPVKSLPLSTVRGRPSPISSGS
mmetsp:Transcript_9368/g.20890  ORF Transcript_9368/g.20890 Transcript_9368/m.20890 type:complete len:207 (+) Transcript_9368:131-751(+)